MRAAAWSLAAILLVGPARADDQGAPPPAGLKRRIRVEGRKTLKEWIKTLRKALDVNIVLDAGVGGDTSPTRIVRLDLRNVTGATALRWVASQYGLDYAVRDNVVLFADHSIAVGRSVLELHEVRHLLVKLQDHPGPDVALAEKSAPGFSVTFEDPRELTVGEEVVVDLIRENVSPAAWDETQSIEQTPDQRLLVSAPLPVQRELERFLDGLNSLAPPTVTVTVEVMEADKAAAALIRPGEAATWSAEAFKKVAPSLEAARRNGRTVQTTQMGTQRTHAARMDEETAVVDLDRRGPVLASGVNQVTVADVRPMPGPHGKFITIELRLQVGRTTAMDPPAKAGSKELTLQARTLARLLTTLRVEDGGAALFALPGRQLCLVRAASTRAGKPLGQMNVLTPVAPEDKALAARLREAKPADIEMKKGTLVDFAEWLRSATGLNVVIDTTAIESPEDEILSVSAKNLHPERILKLVLEPRKFAYALRDEALVITTFDAIKSDVRLALIDVSDLTYGMMDFPGGEGVETQQQFTGEDLADLIQNTIEPDQWDDVDGASIQFQNGALIVRNTADVLRACDEFVASLRKSRPKTVAIRAEMMTLAAAEADAVLGRPGPEGWLIDGARHEKLIRAGSDVERLAWHGFDGQRTSQSWARSVGYLRDFRGVDDPVTDRQTTSSFLDVRPILDKDGKAALLNLRLREQRVVGFDTHSIGVGMDVQRPVTSDMSIRSMLRLPKGRLAVFRSSARPGDDGNPRVRLLIVSAAWKS